MTENLHRALDGDPTAREGLTTRELAELASAEQLIERVLHGIPAPTLPDLGPAVLRRIRALPEARRRARSASRLVRARDWFWSPRPLSIQWRPAYAFALVLLLAGLPMLRNPVTAPAPAGPQQVLVQFRLDAPNAQRVQLAGNFTNWKADVSMKRTGTGVWTVVLPLNPGVHNYSFVVDGVEWVADPMAPAVSDGFGGHNSQLAVLSPDQGRSM